MKRGESEVKKKKHLNGIFHHLNGYLTHFTVLNFTPLSILSIFVLSNEKIDILMSLINNQ